MPQDSTTMPQGSIAPVAPLGRYAYVSGVTNRSTKRNNTMQAGLRLPEITFRTRVRDDALGGDNPFRWQSRTTADYFGGKRTILFSLPGAFTPTCSTYQLPGFEKNAEAFRDLGIDAIYCMSVNDSFVMNKWAQGQGLETVQVIPDGSGEFTRRIGMLVAKDNLGFGMRSWRYAAIVNDGKVEAWFEEPGRCDNHDDDPYGESSPENLLRYLRGESQSVAAE